MKMLRPSFLRASVGPLVLGFLVLVLLLGWVTWFLGEQSKRSAAIRSSIEVVADLRQILSELQDIETGQRGYLLTGEEPYLEPYDSAMAALPDTFSKVNQATVARPYLAEPLARLRTVADERIAIVDTTIAQRRAGDLNDALSLVRSGEGKALMDEARSLVAKMITAENQQLQLTEDMALRTAARIRIAIWCGLAFAIALAIFAIVNAWGQTMGLIRVRDDLQTANAELMAEVRRREEVEGQLRQSQKLEAIGQLTGGLAHDFNNGLAVIISSLSLLKRRLARGEKDTDQFIDAAIEAAHRASTLTKRLLDFSRQQPLAPEPVDLNRLVKGMSEMLRRSLGGNVRLETVLAGGLWLTHVDPTQLENAILNVAVNARDAMPDGGRLTIETQNAHLDERYAAEHAEVKPGQYVLVAITDTGSGMPPEVLAKAFDPFFTTKAVGKGTGLGLSQVFGFTKQSGGHVKIYSEVGAGSTVKLYLPRFIGAMKAQPAPAKPAIAKGAGEVILIVEDEESVRRLTVEGATELGYVALEADSAEAALRILDSRPDVALLLTDVVMPDIDGRKLAEAARSRLPNIRVLYMTGYTRNAIVHNGVLDADVDLLSKPFTLEMLALKLQNAFGRT